MAYTDDEIRKVVLEQLTRDHRIGEANVSVEVHNGEVVLEGTVSSYYGKLAAEADALLVSGVRIVLDRLAIKSSESAHKV
jgi:osmotically-inducible protein OsmY